MINRSSQLFEWTSQ